MLFSFIYYSTISYFLYNSIEYFLHSLGHNYKFNNYIYSLHKKHHLLYSGKKFLSQRYRTEYKYYLSDGTRAHIIPFSSIIMLIYKLTNDYYLIINICFFTYISEYLHTHIHTQNSWLEKYEWFMKKRKKHLIHHKFTNKNINILDNNLDILFHTYREN